MSYELTIKTDGTSDNDAESLATTVTETLTDDVVLPDRWGSYYREPYEAIDGETSPEYVQARAYLGWGADVQAAVDALASALSDQSWLVIDLRTVYYEYRDDEIANDPQHYPPEMATGLRTDPIVECCGPCGVEISDVAYRIDATNYSVAASKHEIEAVDNWRRVAIVATESETLSIETGDARPNTQDITDPALPSGAVLLARGTVPPGERELRRLQAENQYQPASDSTRKYEHGTVPEGV